MTRPNLPYKQSKAPATANPLLSVLVRTRNELAALPEFWRRLSAQTYFPKAEILFLDSGSTDGTIEFLRGLDAGLYAIEPEDFNFGSSCNLLMSLSRAPIAVFLSAHVFLEQDDALERSCEILSAYNYSAAYFRQIPNLLTGASTYEKAQLAKRFPMRSQLFVAMDRPAGFSNAASALTRASWEQLPFPEIHGSEDHAWALQHLALGGKLFYMSGLTAMHSHNESPDALFRRVRLNFTARKKKGSLLRASYYFCGVLFSLLRHGASLSEARSYASAHARAYLP